ncbi:hypothetical protein [Stenotrophomonas maltophilia]|uniref:hypothetical protein n=1 Tax=Stenotrophomonas maltophilia TaxID=40324 RepID=UPI0015DEB8CC|nr:hypothetical protein [Stenotrophomonas maltophilia]MCU1010595.1 hypothetical protein [Stenotrophomonas maltophilia]MEA1826717.1 hypothetical protein [Stenotrophomonas maltophilia]
MVRTPRKTKLGHFADWQQQLENLRVHRKCEGPNFFMPYHFATMALVVKEMGPGKLILPDDITEYAAKLRLWEAIGQNSPLIVERRPASTRYHDLTPLRSTADVDNAASAIAQMLTSHSDSCTSETRNDLYVMLAELLGNCYAHARTQDGLHGLACAQTWYKESRAQFAIADSGIGIRKSLEENADLLHRLAEMNACTLACELGVSSKLGKGHQGYGLTVACDMARRTPGSILFVQSCDEAIFVENGVVQEISSFRHGFSGTLVVFEWDMDTKLDLAEVYANWPQSQGDGDEFF